MTRKQLESLTNTQLDTLYKTYSTLGVRPIQFMPENRDSVIKWLLKMITEQKFSKMGFKYFRYRFYYRNGVAYCVAMSEHAHLRALVNEIYSYVGAEMLINTEFGLLGPFKLN